MNGRMQRRRKNDECMSTTANAGVTEGTVALESWEDQDEEKTFRTDLSVYYNVLCGYPDVLRMRAENQEDSKLSRTK